MVDEGAAGNISVQNYQLIALYVLLAMQIRFDTTGIKNSPSVWYAGKYTLSSKKAFQNFLTGTEIYINMIVKKLKLKRFLKYKETTGPDYYG